MTWMETGHVRKDLIVRNDMAKEHRYNVYDGDTPIGFGMYPSQIREMLKIPWLKPGKYAKYGYLAEGRYRITSDDIEERWEEAVKPFRKVQWMKYGGFNLSRAWQEHLKSVKEGKEETEGKEMPERKNMAAWERHIMNRFMRGE